MSVRKFLFAGMLTILAACLTLTVALPAPARAQGAALNDDSLAKMLGGMGYAPKKLTKGFLIVARQDKWTLNVQVVLSADQSKIGLNANLGDVPNDQAVTAPQWKALLVANVDIDPSAFYFDVKQKRLYLHRSFDNRAVTSAVLKGQIDYFMGNIRSTASLWSFTK
jgi:hypothetical protein